MHTSITKNKIAAIVVFGFFFLFVVFASMLVNKYRHTSNAKASSFCQCTDPEVCYPDGCSRKPKTNDNQFDEGRYDSVCSQFDPGYRISDELLVHFCSSRQPDCCFDIYKYKDTRLCCFQERWTCHPSLCAGASGSSGCGKYWSLPGDWSTYGCVKSQGGQTVPAWGLPQGLPIGNPTNPPITQPTNTQAPPPPTNTIIPTNPSIQPPSVTNTPSVQIPATQYPTNTQVTPTTYTPSQLTETPSPTYFVNPTIAAIPTPTTKPKTAKEIASNFINPNNINVLNEYTKKPLNAPIEGYEALRNIDRSLESFVNIYIMKVKIFLISINPLK